MTDIYKFVDIQNALNASILGKRLPDALYIHYSAVTYLADVLQQYESFALIQLVINFHNLLTGTHAAFNFHGLLTHVEILSQ
jgi:hypothetical protein